MLTYKEYKYEKDAFWSDIPHEKCQMVTKKKRVKRKYVSIRRRQQSCISPQQNIKLKTKWRKRKQRKLNVKKTKSEEVPSEFMPTEILHKRVDNKNNQPSCPFHLFVKSRTSYKIEIKDPLKMDVLQKLIKEHDNIPTELQMITHHGKLLRHSRLKQLESGDTIHVIVRGKGGGKSKPPKKETEAPVETVTDAGLQNVTSEIEFQKWLRETVKIPEELFHREGCDLNILDLMTFREYEKAAELKNEINLPAGIAKKMLYFKNNHLGQKVKNYEIDFLKSFTIGHVGRLAKKVFTNEPNIETIVDTISKECIDGFVIMLYANHIELEEDLDIKRAYARKLLVHAQNEIKIMHAESCQGMNDSLSSTKEFLSVNLDIEVKHFTNEQLHECHLFAIHSAWEEKKNELAESFLFWVLSSDILSSHEQHKLWLAIVKNMQTWLQTLPKNEQGLFTPGKSKGRFQYKKGKNVSVCETGEKMKSVHDVSPHLRKSYKNHILICYGDISNKSYVLKWKTEQLQVNIGKTRAWTYKEDGFKQIKIIEDVQSDSTDFESKASLTPSKTVSKSSGSLTQTDSQENNMSLEYFGEMAAKYAPSTQTNEGGKTEKPEVMYSESSVFLVQPRNFKHSPNTCVYFKDQVMDRPEGGSGMITPSLEFKIFSSCHEEENDVKPMTKFLSETLRFACGCLNRRRNGTILFGIADDKEVKGKLYRHGQVVGFPILELDAVSKSKYTDALNTAKNSFDSPEANNAARECIKDPVFVRISPSSPQMPLYVMEVDIEPTYSFCKGIKFKVGLAKILKSKLRPQLFVRDGPETRELKDSEEAVFALELDSFDKKRQQEEQNNYYEPSMDPDHKYNADKLVRKLCKGSSTFDPTSVWSILVTSKPTDSMKHELYSSLNFIQNIPWTAVFEFDDSSMINGLGRNFFQSDRYILCDGEIFRDVENNIELRNCLKVPEKGVFIFCNGRSDQEPKKDHFSHDEWKKNYSPSVKGAINFFQQKSVIPIGRAVIFFLLFANDFEGFLDIFGEMSMFFGNSQVILLCPDSSVFDYFEKTALVQKSVSIEDLKNKCIVGMSWEHCNECINDLMGIEKHCLKTVPCSSKVIIKIEKNTEESLNSLQIVSSTECEGKIFTNYDNEKIFENSKELKFYQGNKVEWWNFHFEHVMKRHCFTNLVQKVRTALSTHQKHTPVFPIFLYHEPGAGGSTLARHILWEFHKEFRCAVVTQLEHKTASDILRFWEYKEEKNPQPVLLLIDSVSDQKIDLDTLVKDIGKQKLDFLLRLHVCVLLVCCREEVIDLQKYEMSVRSSEILTQKVDKNEQKWLQRKIEELEDKSEDLGLTDFKGEYFISFMILHSNFDKEYLLETVKYLLKDFDMDNCQFKLLMFVSLIITYVSPSKYGSARALPLESCNEIMGLNSRMQGNLHHSKAEFWENYLDSRIKIFLVIEPKEMGSGKQIRMAHPIIAKIVLKCIMKTKPLKDIAEDFLKCRILTTDSFARADVQNLAVEMLTRRKKEEYNDAVTTTFSPLIEDVLEDSGKYDAAAFVLKSGFKVLEDAKSYVAHQLSRLYLKFKEFDQARKWGEEAVQLNGSRSDFFHTLGLVYRHKLLNLDISDKSEVRIRSDDPQLFDAFDLGLEAFKLFCEASKKIDVNLLASRDAIVTANDIARVILKVVDAGQRDALYLYLHEKDQIPEVFKTWTKYHAQLKSLFCKCVEHINILDEYIYFCRRSYLSNYEVKEHRYSKTVKRMLPKIMTDFASNFGPSEITDEPPSYLETKDSRDGWHRHCILALDGSRLVSIFKIVQMALLPANVSQMNTKKMSAKEKLLCMQWHLQLIESKTTDDHLNLIYVNLALAQLKTKIHTLSSLTELFHICKQIIQIEQREYPLSMAYLCIMMFQWLFVLTKSSQYDHELMLKTMKHLHEYFIATKQKQKKPEKNIFKGEKSEYQSAVLFYLGKGHGLASLIHYSLLPQAKHFEQIWQNHNVKDRLLYIDGFTRIHPNSGSVSVVVDLTKYGFQGEIEIRKMICGRQELTERPISFFLGLTQSGPVVCYIKPRTVSLDPPGLFSDYVDFDELSISDLRELLEKVDDLKKESDPLSLNDHELKLLNERQLIIEALRRHEKDESLID